MPKLDNICVSREFSTFGSCLAQVPLIRTAAGCDHSETCPFKTGGAANAKATFMQLMQSIDTHPLTVAKRTLTLRGVVAKVNTTLANALGLPSADDATLGTAVVTANVR